MIPRLRSTATPNMARVLFASEGVILLLVLMAAWSAWSAWPAMPLSDADTWGYLNPALSWLSGLGFRQTDGRDWFYPAFVALFLKTTGSFAGIVGWQKALGLAADILMAVTWRCWVSLLPFNRWARFAVTLLGAVPIYFQVMNPQNIFFEASIRPEGILPLFAYAQLACLMGYCKYRWQAPRAVPSILLGAAAIFFAYACYLLKPSWYFAFGTTSAPVIAGLFGRALPWKVRLGIPALAVAAVFLGLWLPGKIFLIPDGSSRTMLPDALFCVHAELIDELLETRLAALADSDPEKARLQRFVTTLEDEIRAAKVDHVYKKLGIDADYLMHSHAMSAAIVDYAGADRGKFSVFCFSCFGQAVLHYPLAYTRKVFEQFEYFLFPAPDTFYLNHINLTKPLRDSVDSLAPYAGAVLSPDVGGMFRRYRESLNDQLAPGQAIDIGRRPRRSHPSASIWPLPLEVLFFVALIVAYVCPRWHALRLGAGGAFFLFLAPFGNAFGVCIVHTLDIYRYRVTYGGCFLFALSAMAVVVAATVAWVVPRTGGRHLGERRD
jgi:hypothetical protein